MNQNYAIQTFNLKKIFFSPDSSKSIEALKGISIEVKYGEIFGIIGTSGAGKSSLLRCLTGLDRPTQGSIYIDGEEWTALSPHELKLARRKTGLIFQNFCLFSGRTALENVCYPFEISGVSKKTSKEKSKELLQLVGLENRINAYPAQLSGGEKQRVAIARAIALKPKILFCDEATSALDPQTTQSILALLREINKTLGLTIFLITHEMEVIKSTCDKVAVLEGGTIVEKGRTIDLFSKAKHSTTRKFLQSIPHEIPATFLSSCEKTFLKLTFTGESARKPVISMVIRNFHVEVNILLGGIDVLKDQEILGTLVIELNGSLQEREKALNFLKEHGVICEVISK